MFKNLSWLAIHKLLKIVIPFLLIPYFINILGAENWGKIVYVQYFFSFFLIAIAYGFDIYGVKLISENKENDEELSKIFSSVIFIKTMVFIISLVVITICAMVFQRFEELRIIMLFSLGLLFSQVLNGIWVFQGIEKMQFIPLTTFIESSIYLTLVFFLINNDSDYLLVPLSQTIALIFSSFLSLFFILKFTPIYIRLVPFQEILNLAKSGFQFFISTVCAIINSKSIIIVIGLFLPYSVISYFDLSLKIITALTIPFGVFADVIFPEINRTKNLLKANKFLLISLLSSSILYLILIGISDFLMSLIGGASFLEFKYTLLILGLTIPLNAIVYVLATSFLVSFGFKNEANMANIYSMFIYFLFTIFAISLGMTNSYIFALLFAFRSLTDLVIRLIYSIRFNLLKPYWKLSLFQLYYKKE